MAWDQHPLNCLVGTLTWTCLDQKLSVQVFPAKFVL